MVRVEKTMLFIVIGFQFQIVAVCIRAVFSGRLHRHFYNIKKNIRMQKFQKSESNSSETIPYYVQTGKTRWETQQRSIASVLKD